MQTKTRTLQSKDINKIYLLDKKWFGEYGISKSDLEKIVKNQSENTIVLVKNDEIQGFAIFEILQNEIPRDYVGDIHPNGKLMFIKQFTTLTNYKIENSRSDDKLLDVLETKAKELGCDEIWEALAINHPYKKESNKDFDAFGFYKNHGYTVDQNKTLTWQPSENISISCYLFRKKIQ